jgi:hypothetical protein
MDVGSQVDYKDPMLANFIELLAEILVESLDRTDDSEDRACGGVLASADALEESSEAQMKEVPQPVVPETTV